MEDFMKKIISILLLVLLVAALFAGCAPKTPSPAPTNTAPANTTPASQEPTTGKVKTGLAIITSIASSKDAGEADGLAQADSLIAAVIVDSNGKIVDCAIDAAQTKVNFNAYGQLVTDLGTEFKTKNELGADYGMKKVSGIGKEWYEQAEGFAAYVIGKTAAEVRGIAVDEEGRAGGSDLKATITVHIGDFIEVVAKAAENAQDLGAAATDKVSLGTVTNIANSKHAGDSEGLAQIYSTYTAVTRDSAGKITSCIIDASQSNINFDAKGKISTDISAPVASKNELGDSYGMKKASSIGKEWYEQAAAFAKYVTGKTASEVAGISVDEEGLAADTDLKASVTIHVGDFKSVLAKALA
jgi:predicted small lipoprotein YifL